MIRRQWIIVTLFYLALLSCSSCSVVLAGGPTSPPPPTLHSTTVTPNHNNNNNTNTTGLFHNKYLMSWWLAPLASFAMFLAGLILFIIGRSLRDCCCPHLHGGAGSIKSAPFRPGDESYVAYPGEHYPAEGDDQSMTGASVLASGRTRNNGNKNRNHAAVAHSVSDDDDGDQNNLIGQQQQQQQQKKDTFRNPVAAQQETHNNNNNNSDTPRWDHAAADVATRQRADSAYSETGEKQNYSLYDDHED